MSELEPFSTELDIDQLRTILAHRPPFLMVERVTDIVRHESAIGWKAVGINEPYFTGHFPEYPVMPGVLIVEALAQTAVVLASHSYSIDLSNSLVYFMSIDKARFRRPVRPGDMLRLLVRLTRRRGPVWRFEGKAYVDDTLCAQAEFSAMLTPAKTKEGGAKGEPKGVST